MSLGLRRRNIGKTALALPFLASMAGAGRSAWAAEPSVLRVSPNADLAILDPHVTAATTTLTHGLLIYDVLYALDETLTPQPQMIGQDEVSADKLTWQFALRPGLKFHDGSPVTTRDVIASVKRWMPHDAMGRVLSTTIVEMEPVDQRIFRIRLKEPFPHMRFTLANSSSAVPVIMREKEALTDTYTPIRETIGSGPFRFVRNDWVVGSRVVYERNPDYVPRDEPPNGLAGGKKVNLDRVEFRIIPDASTKSNALRLGEIDFIDQLSYNQAGVLARAPGVTVGSISPINSQGYIRFNALYPPFNNLKARQAVALTVNQADYMTAAVDKAEWWRTCYSYFICGTQNGIETGSDAYRKPDLARAKQLLAESGYNGEKVVLLSSHDLDYIGALIDVAAYNLRELGINLDVAESDWGTLMTRRTNKNAPTSGGWNLFVTTTPGSSLFSPLINPVTDQTCGGGNYVGWPCDAKSEELRAAYIRADDPAKQRSLLEAIHTQLWETLPSALLGQYTQIYGWRNNVHDIPRTPSSSLPFWGVRKT